MPREHQHQAKKHFYMGQMVGKYDPVKHRRRHHYAHEQVAVVEEPKPTQPATEETKEETKTDIYQ